MKTSNQTTISELQLLNDLAVAREVMKPLPSNPTDFQIDGWIAGMRHLHYNGHLPEFAVARLEQIPDWSWHPHASTHNRKFVAQLKKRIKARLNQSPGAWYYIVTCDLTGDTLHTGARLEHFDDKESLQSSEILGFFVVDTSGLVVTEIAPGFEKLPLDAIEHNCCVLQDMSSWTVGEYQSIRSSRRVIYEALPPGDRGQARGKLVFGGTQ